MSTWEERMAQRVRQRELETRRARTEFTGADFSNWLELDDPAGILQQILAARCLGISYGDPGPKLEPEVCRECWGDRHVWLGNAWGLQHVGKPPVPGTGLFGCGHGCHVDEVWLAGPAVASGG